MKVFCYWFHRDLPSALDVKIMFMKRWCKINLWTELYLGEDGIFRAFPPNSDTFTELPRQAWEEMQRFHLLIEEMERLENLKKRGQNFPFPAYWAILCPALMFVVESMGVPTVYAILLKLAILLGTVISLWGIGIRILALVFYRARYPSLKKQLKASGVIN